MLRRVLRQYGRGGTVYQQCRSLSQKAAKPTVSPAIDSMIHRSLKNHYVEVSNMSPPPKVSLPEEFTIVEGAIESNGPVLKRQFNNEEISVSVTRFPYLVQEDCDNIEDPYDDSELNQLFVHVDICKPGKIEPLNILCGLYPNALDIQSVSLRQKSDGGLVFGPRQFPDPLFNKLDEKTRDAFHNYIVDRGIDEDLFPFLQAWLYIKDRRSLLRWFKSVGSFISGSEAIKEFKHPEGAAGVNGPTVAQA